MTEPPGGIRGRVAASFKALGDPLRLAIVDALRAGERNVSELVRSTGAAQANVSKHLQVLHAAGIVQRRRSGLFTSYRLADPAVAALCDLMSQRVARTDGDAFTSAPA